MKNSPKPFPFKEYRDFFAANENWPRLNDLRQTVEESLNNTIPDIEVAKWYDKYPPRTPRGYIVYLTALKGLGENDKLRLASKRAWIKLNFSPQEEARFLSMFGAHLSKDDYRARLDHLLWSRQTDAASRIIDQLPAQYKPWATARIALQTNDRNAKRLLSKISPHMSRESGLIFDRLRWYRKRDDLRGTHLLEPRYYDRDHPQLWWQMRKYFAREALNQGNPKEAYEIMQQYRCDSAACTEEAESFLGFVKLRFLQDPSAAFKHFRNAFDRVKTPLSKTKAAYWLGQAVEDMGKPEIAKKWYEIGSKAPTTFYGQLCIKALGKSIEIKLSRSAPKIPRNEVDKFNKREYVRLTRLLGVNGFASEAHPFLYHLYANATNKHQRMLAIELSQEVSPEYAVKIAKAAARRAAINRDWVYPTRFVPKDVPIDRSLVFAIIRQESDFDPESISSAGAVGLMQILPNTARMVANDLNISYCVKKLRNNPQYNVQLGVKQLQNMLKKFGGSKVLAIAAYNAGEVPVGKWLQRMGHPDKERLADWIERIPYSQTRKYVKRVLSNEKVYDSLKYVG